VLRQISLALAEAGVESSEQLFEENEDRGGNDQAHSLAYRRLRDTGWLIRSMSALEDSARSSDGGLACLYTR
jgi:hypothetical protein